MNKEIELKPCPFCGGEAHVYQDYTGHYTVQCDKCGIGTLSYNNKKTAKRQWNRRVRNVQKEAD